LRQGTRPAAAFLSRFAGRGAEFPARLGMAQPEARPQIHRALPALLQELRQPHAAQVRVRHLRAIRLRRRSRVHRSGRCRAAGATKRLICEGRFPIIHRARIANDGGPRLHLIARSLRQRLDGRRPVTGLGRRAAARRSCLPPGSIVELSSQA